MAASAEKQEDNSALAFLRELIVAQQQGEAAVQLIIANRLAAAGCTIDTHEYDPALVPVTGEFASDKSRDHEPRTVVVGTLDGVKTKRSLLMFAHPDGEPVTQPHNWSHDPIAGVIDGSRMYGWGIADDLAGCAAAVLAIEKAASSSTPLGQVMFASSPSKRYARGVAAVLHNGLGADASLYLHPAESGVGMREIKAVASVQLEFTITISGKLPATTEPGHTAFSHMAVNPVDKAMKVLAALMAFAEVRAARVHHPRLHAAVGRSTNIQISNIQCGDMNRYSRLNEQCVLGGAVSFPPGETYATVQQEIESAISKCADDDEWLQAHPPKFEWLTGVTGAEVDDSHPLYETTSDVVRRVTGSEPFVNAMHTSSDIRNPAVEKGIPTVGLGCLGGDLSQNGKHDEWIDVADFLRMVEVTTSVICDWCAMEKPLATS